MVLTLFSAEVKLWNLWIKYEGIIWRSRNSLLNRFIKVSSRRKAEEEKKKKRKGGGKKVLKTNYYHSRFNKEKDREILFKYRSK